MNSEIERIKKEQKESKKEYDKKLNDNVVKMNDL